jgi:hypothetical protein
MYPEILSADYTEEVDYIQGCYVEPDEIKKFLIDVALNW